MGGLAKAAGIGKEHTREGGNGAIRKRFESRCGFGDAVAIGLGSVVGRCGGWGGGGGGGGCATATVVIPDTTTSKP